MTEEKPILMNAAMIRATMADRKWQTRRIVKFDKKLTEDFMNDKSAADSCPYGKPGGALWVRETSGVMLDTGIRVFRADGGWAESPDFAKKCLVNGKWTPGIHMFRKDSRILLKVRGVRVERILDITEEDARSEGAFPVGRQWGHDPSSMMAYKTARDSFLNLWASINGKQSVASNPWVWVVEFSRVTA